MNSKSSSGIERPTILLAWPDSPACLDMVSAINRREFGWNWFSERR